MKEEVTGMVLSQIPVGEWDKRLVILTKEYGKISAFARGARRAKSPLLGGTEPFMFGKFAIYRGRNSYYITGADIQNGFGEIREDLTDIYMGLFFCEVADFCCREDMEGTEVLKLLYQSLRALKVESIGKDLVKHIFCWKMLAFNGVIPRVFACVHCGEHQNLTMISYESQGMICQNCLERGVNPGGKKMQISQAAVYALQYIVATPPESLYQFTLSEKVKEEFCQVTELFFYEFTGRRFPAEEMLATVGE